MVDCFDKWYNLFFEERDDTTDIARLINIKLGKVPILGIQVIQNYMAVSAVISTVITQKKQIYCCVYLNQIALKNDTTFCFIYMEKKNPSQWGLTLWCYFGSKKSN